MTSQSLSGAARAFKELRLAQQAAAPTSVAAAVGDARADLAYQAYLNFSVAPGATATLPGAVVSPFAVQADIDRVDLNATRASTGAGVQAGAAHLTANTLPTSTAIGAGGSLGGADVAAIASSGSKSKTIVGLATVGPVGAGLAATLVSTDKIRPLSAPLVGADGVARQLARFSTSAMPVLDANLGVVGDVVGVGGRALVSVGRSATYEKYVPVSELAAMMRQRSHPLRNLTETIAAVTGRGTLRPPTRRQMAADLGAADRLRLGESVTWEGSFGLYLGVSAGGMGMRASAGVMARGSSVYRLEPVDSHAVCLAFQPLAVRGIRLGAEAKLLVDAGVDLLQVASQTRSWRFDLRERSSRQALSQALRGKMPGMAWSSAARSYGDVIAAMAGLQDERLPAGVTSLSATFSHQRELGVSASFVRLPELLGGHTLGAAWTASISTSGSVVGGEGSRPATRQFSRSASLLALGDGRASEAASLVSALSIGPRGEHVLTPTSLETEVVLEASRSGRFGRRQLVRRLSDAVGEDVALGPVATSSRYEVRVKRQSSLRDLAPAATLSVSRLAGVAENENLPAQALRAVHKTLGRAAEAGDPDTLTRELTGLAVTGAVGLRAVAALAGSPEDVVSVTNEGHDQILGDFLKAETYLAGAARPKHAKQAAERLAAIGDRIDAAVAEIAEDGALSLVSRTEATDRRTLLVAVQKEAAALHAHASSVLRLAKT